MLYRSYDEALYFLNYSHCYEKKFYYELEAVKLEKYEKILLHNLFSIYEKILCILSYLGIVKAAT